MALQSRDESMVAITKGQYGNGKPMCYALVARRDIPAGVVLLETAASMSKDKVKGSGVSHVVGHPSQLGPAGKPRSIGDSFRAMNHDCLDPNAQVSQFCQDITSLLPDIPIVHRSFQFPARTLTRHRP